MERANRDGLDAGRLVCHLASMPPPTIAKLKSMGVRRFSVTCSKFDCRHSANVDFAQAGLPDNLYFPDIAMVRRVTCAKCGGRDVGLMPDWTTHRAADN